ncbi:O13/O129/O135 family O-antigen flippase [Uliginosibacterium flavum]|uniref:Oligosaccharide flippase family protein n=1 Tax=Uliginosibacterium flavum TaxID=1396831 RepID=A0ABV2TT39_9RHOO
MSASAIGKHTLWNILGQVLPILVAIIAIPLLVQRLGMDRYGFLTLVWVLVGYVGIFDFGVGRAMTRVVAERLGANDIEGAERNARAALSFLFGMGLVLGLGMLLLSKQILGALSVPAEMHQEALHALQLLSASVPLVMLTSGYRGYLEAHRKFAVLNLVRAVMGIFTYAAPLIATAFSPSLVSIVASVLITRLIANFAHRWACQKCDAAALHFELPSIARLKPMLTLGGWMTVSNIISPLMGSLDRLLIAGLVSVGMIGMYATAFDTISKVLIVAYSLTGALFPVFAGLQQADEVQENYRYAIKAMLLLVWPILFIASLFAKPIFNIWMGAEFATHAAPAMQILAIGLFFNCMAQVPAMLIHSRGDPKWMAALHLVEMPVYLVLIYVCTSEWGVLGTAAAWATRTTLDLVALHWIVLRRISPDSVPFRHMISIGVAAAVLVASLFIHLPTLHLFVLGSVSILIFVFCMWNFILSSAEREFIHNILLRKILRKFACGK